MRESRWDMFLYKSKSCLIYMLCMALFLGGCSAEEILGLTGEELLAVSEETVTERTLSLEEIEGKDASQESQKEQTDMAQEWQMPENGSFLYEGYDFAYQTLSETEQIWYRDMEQILGCMGEDVKLSQEGLNAGLSESQIDRIFQCVLDDHPELFYVEGYSYTRYTQGTKVVAIEFSGTYSMDSEEALNRKKEIEQAVGQILLEAEDLEDDYDKIKFVYDTLVENTDYNVNAEDNQNIYSVFVNQESVCQGYAKAFQYLLYRLGVECTLVQGTVLSSGEGHAWNLVKSNGEYYYVDPTWGDISYRSAGQEDESGSVQQTASQLSAISYDYLCVNDEQLFLTHEADCQENLPKCTAVSDNYFVREGALFEEYDEEQFALLLERKLAAGEMDISVRCSNESCYRDMVAALLDGQEMFTYLAGSGIQSFAYSRNDSQRTMTFFMMTSQG